MIIRILLACVVCLCLSGLASAESASEAEEILEKAGKLHQTAQSADDTTRVLAEYKRALALFEALGDETRVCAINRSIGTVHLGRRQYAKALERYKRGLKSARRLGDNKQYAEILSEIGDLYLQWGLFKKALLYYGRSRTTAVGSGSKPAEANALERLGNAYRSFGRFREAEKEYRKLLGIRVSLEDPQGQDRTLGDLAALYLKWGRYPKAMECCRQSLAIAERQKDESAKTSTLTSMGMVYSAWGRHKRALQSLADALGTQTAQDDPKRKADILAMMGREHRLLGDNEAALKSLQQAVSVITKSGESALRLKNIMAKLLLDMGDLPRAWGIIRKEGSLENMGRFSLEKSYYPMARMCYEKLANSPRTEGDYAVRIAAYTGLAGAYEGLGKLAKAEEFLRKAVSMVQDVRSALTRAEKKRLALQPDRYRLMTAPFEGLSRVLMRLDKPSEAMVCSDLVRSWGFGDVVAKVYVDTEPAFQVPRYLLRKDAELNNQLAAVSHEFSERQKQGDEEAVKKIIQLLNTIRGKLDRHISRLRRRFPMYAAALYPTPPGDGKASLSVNESVLTYDVTDSGLLVHLIRGKKHERSLVKPVKRRELRRLVLQLRKTFHMTSADSVERQLSQLDLEACKRLSDLLLGEVIDGLPRDEPVTIVPDDCLSLLPFEMLVLNDRGKVEDKDGSPTVVDAEFFADRNPLSYYHSFRQLEKDRLARKKVWVPARVLVIADPVYPGGESEFSGGPNPPAGINPELQRLYEDLFKDLQEGRPSGLPPERSSGSEEPEADLSVLLKGKAAVRTVRAAGKRDFLLGIAPGLRRYGVLVFGLYGYFGEQLPGIGQPTLVFSVVPPGTDGWLRMSEVMNLRMRAGLVAITAGNTGLVPTNPGFCATAMGRAFQCAGARALLTSLWTVPADCSGKLVASFVKFTKQGKSKLEALKLARGELRSSGYDHPFYWASFILVGDVD
ncbi:CHAT domain-containing tetratricopeptide repeat protein [Thermodesulfobacteriota bacterium]